MATKKKAAANKKEKKISRNITLSEGVHNYVVELGKSAEENRNFSNMAEKLILEAKAERDKKQ